EGVHPHSAELLRVLLREQRKVAITLPRDEPPAASARALPAGIIARTRARGSVRDGRARENSSLTQLGSSRRSVTATLASPRRQSGDASFAAHAGASRVVAPGAI